MTTSQAAALLLSANRHIKIWPVYSKVCRDHCEWNFSFCKGGCDLCAREQRLLWIFFSSSLSNRQVLYSTALCLFANINKAVHNNAEKAADSLISYGCAIWPKPHISTQVIISRWHTYHSIVNSMNEHAFIFIWYFAYISYFLSFIYVCLSTVVGYVLDLSWLQLCAALLQKKKK